MNKTASNLCNVAAARDRAKRILPSVLFDTIDGGTDDELSVRDNQAAYAEVKLLSRGAAFPTEQTIAKTVLGMNLSMPIILDPCGGVRLLRKDGDRAVVRAAGKAGISYAISTGSGTTPEDMIAAASGPLSFQLHFVGTVADAEGVVDRVQKAGFHALFVTVDSTGIGNRERLFKHRATIPMKRSARHAIHYMPEMIKHPRWTLGYLSDGAPVTFTTTPLRSATDPEPESWAFGIGEDGKSKARLSPLWKDIDWIRKQWHGPLVVKGILTADDARKARDHGADAILVSNHGGRQMDGVPGTLRTLPAISAAVGGDVEILIDGGIRRGTDVIKALALGADAVMFGRPYLYGLAAAGQDGVERVLEIFHDDLLRALAHLGCSSIDEVNPSLIDASGLATVG